MDDIKSLYYKCYCKYLFYIKVNNNNYCLKIKIIRKKMKN